MNTISKYLGFFLVVIVLTIIVSIVNNKQSWREEGDIYDLEIKCSKIFDDEDKIVILQKNMQMYPLSEDNKFLEYSIMTGDCSEKESLETVVDFINFLHCSSTECWGEGIVNRKKSNSIFFPLGINTWVDLDSSNFHYDLIYFNFTNKGLLMSKSLPQKKSENLDNSIDSIDSIWGVFPIGN